MAGAWAECREAVGEDGLGHEGREAVAKLSPQIGGCQTDKGRLLHGKGVCIPGERDHGDTEK